MPTQSQLLWLRSSPRRAGTRGCLVAVVIAVLVVMMGVGPVLETLFCIGGTSPRSQPQHSPVTPATMDDRIGKMAAGVLPILAALALNGARVDALDFRDITDMLPPFSFGEEEKPPTFEGELTEASMKREIALAEENIAKLKLDLDEIAELKDAARKQRYEMTEIAKTHQYLAMQVAEDDTFTLKKRYKESTKQLKEAKQRSWEMNEAADHAKNEVSSNLRQAERRKSAAISMLKEIQ